MSKKEKILAFLKEVHGVMIKHDMYLIADNKMFIDDGSIIDIISAITFNGHMLGYWDHEKEEYNLESYTKNQEFQCSSTKLFKDKQKDEDKHVSE